MAPLGEMHCLDCAGVWDAALVINDTAVPKKGKHSVGVVVGAAAETPDDGCQCRFNFPPNVPK